MIGILFLPIVIISVICEEDHYFYANPLSKAINKMTADLYLEILKSNPNRNIVISPLSIHTAMSLIYYGSSGDSRDQLRKALGLNNFYKEEHQEEVRYIYDEYKEIDDRNMSFHMDDKSSSWMESYMSQRSQRVFLDGELSDSLPVEVGVPQGSILGPILFCLMVNDFPEVAHNHPPDDLKEGQPSYWNTYCSSCGGISCFADDSSFSKSNKNPTVLNEEIKEKYSEISEYMAANRLVLNSDKTHLLVMASGTQHRLHGNYGIMLDTGSEIIKPQNNERLLGCQISSNFSWKDHIKDC